jgi:mRNA interferase MazF
MIIAGTVVLVEFRGVHQSKRRPALVLSTDLYHSIRPDVILGIITTQIAQATAKTDYLLLDWKSAGLHLPSVFRAFLETHPVTAIVQEIGQLSDRDWNEVQTRLRLSIAV